MSTPTPSTLTLNALQKAVQFIIDLSRNSASATAPAGEVDTLLTSLLSTTKNPAVGLTPCNPITPLNAAPCDQLSLSAATAQSSFVASATSAKTSLTVAVDVWNLAIQQYHYAVVTAFNTLSTQTAASCSTYNAGSNQSPVAWYQLESAALAAELTYEQAVASADVTLAGAAGTLLSAYATYNSAVRATEAQRFTTLSAANETLWSNLESAQD